MDALRVVSEAVGGESLMGKIYDALRRAEEQRLQLSAEPQRQVHPSAPTLAAAERSTGKAWFWRRWIERRLGARSQALVEEPGSGNKRRIAMLRPDSFAAEQFRTLRTRLDSIAAQHPLRTIAIASALPGEGKTLAAVNLAVVSAMSVGRRVLLVDCDLRRPRVHTTLGLSPETGLAEVLKDHATLSGSVIKVEGLNLEVLGVRAQPPNPSELLASTRMRSLVEEAARAYDRVIFDVPPTLALPDAKTVCDLSDGVVLVVRAGSTRSEDVAATLDVIDRRRVLGLVLNGLEDSARRYGYSE
jgi:capsular exopolysaccharide synthesis family protein